MLTDAEADPTDPDDAGQSWSALPLRGHHGAGEPRRAGVHAAERHQPPGARRRAPAPADLLQGGIPWGGFSSTLLLNDFRAIQNYQDFDDAVECNR
jgi:hypothetical protein